MAVALRRLAEGDSVASRRGLQARMVNICAEDAVDAGGSPVGGSGGMSSVTGIGTGGSVGSSNAPTGPRCPGHHPSSLRRRKGYPILVEHYRTHLRA